MCYCLQAPHTAHSPHRVRFCSTQGLEMSEKHCARDSVKCVLHPVQTSHICNVKAPQTAAQLNLHEFHLWPQDVPVQTEARESRFVVAQPPIQTFQIILVQLPAQHLLRYCARVLLRGLPLEAGITAQAAGSIFPTSFFSPTFKVGRARTSLVYFQITVSCIIGT